VTVANDSHTHDTRYLRSDTSDTISGDLTITGQNALICDGVDSGNPSAGADDLRVSGYGILGNRGTMYITNGGGVVQIGTGSTHSTSPQMTVGSGYVTFEGDLNIPDQIIHSGDADTYMQFNAADTWRVVTGGSQRFLVNNSGAQVNNGRMLISTNDRQFGALDLDVNVTNTNNDFYFAQEINMTLSGSQAATSDREQGGIYMDINATNTGGDTSNEHRAYGMYIDLDATGDSDVVYGVYSNATGTPTTGQITSISGGYFFGEDNGGAGAVSNVYGVQGYAYSDNTTSDTNTLTGGYFASVITADSAAVSSTTRGVYAEVQIDATNDVLTTTRVVEAQYDNNSGQTQTNTTALFYGNYAGILPTTAYGVEIVDVVDNYFAGSLQIGDRIKHVGDTDTYMQFHEANQWRVVTGGSERLEVNNSFVTSTKPVRVNSSQPFYENSQVVSGNYTISNNFNAMSAGPITINNGVTVTIGDGEAWTVV